MASLKARYENMIQSMTDWVTEAARQDVLTLMDIIEQGKAYLRAAGDLTRDELTMLEDVYLRDMTTLSHQWQREAQRSVWLTELTNRFVHTLAQMSDAQRLQWFELNADLRHKGLYKSGELVAMGDLHCTQCDYIHRVEFVDTVQPCPQCGCEQFSRTPC